MSNEISNHFEHKLISSPTLEDYLEKGVLEKGSNFWTYMSRIKAGQPKDYKTNFYGKDTPREDILNSWAKILENGNCSESLMSYENDMRSKVGPMSIMKPLNERIPDIEHYYSMIHGKISYDEGKLRMAKNAWHDEFKGIFGLRQRDLHNTVEKMKKSTNSGAPYFTKRREIVDVSLRAAKSVGPFSTLYSSGWKDNACILGWRGQEGGMDVDDVKQRVIWMFPFAVNIAELSVYQPLIEACQHSGLVPAWVSMDAVDKRVTDLFDSCGGETIICTDFSKFDQHFNSEMQDLAEEAIWYILAAKNSNWLQLVFPIKYNIPIICSGDLVMTGQHGMASGSGGTNADETMAHRVLQHYAAATRNAKLNPNSQCLGDDGILSYPGINVDDVISAYESFGQECNKDKQYVDSNSCVYLRRWHSKDYRLDGICRGVYSTYRAIGRLTAQERFYKPEFWSPEMVALRQLSIIENVKWHPMRDKFAEWCMKGDKYRLGIDLPGFIDKLSHYVDVATDYMPDFLGYVRSQSADATRTQLRNGIHDWWIVKYLKSYS